MGGKYSLVFVCWSLLCSAFSLSSRWHIFTVLIILISCFLLLLLCFLLIYQRSLSLKRAHSPFAAYLLSVQCSTSQTNVIFDFDYLSIDFAIAKHWNKYRNTGFLLLCFFNFEIFVSGWEAGLEVVVAASRWSLACSTHIKDVHQRQCRS